MHFIQSALYPFSPKCRQSVIHLPVLMTGGCMLFCAVVGGGFLYTVGLKILSLTMAAAMVLFVALFMTFLMVGYCWERLGVLIENPQEEKLPVFANWRIYILEGAQLIVFYGFLSAFLVSLTVFLYPAGLIVPLLVILMHPLLFVPVLFSAREGKTLLGLLEGMLDAWQLLKGDYIYLWAETTLYLVLFGGLLYPLLMGIASLTVLGIILVPTLLLALFTGYAHLISSLMTEDIPISSDLPSTNPFQQSSVMAAECLRVQSEPQAVLLEDKPSPWQRRIY